MKVKLSFGQAKPSVVGIREYKNSDGSISTTMVNVDLSDGSTKLASLQKHGKLHADGTFEPAFCDDQGNLAPTVRINGDWIAMNSAGAVPQAR